MEIKYFSPHWGSEALPFRQFADRVLQAGFDGVEMSLPLEKGLKSMIMDTLKESGLSLIAQHWETVDPDFTAHQKNYEARLRNLAAAEPLLINAQTGKDYFSFGQNEALIELAAKISDETGVPIVHETHRGKFSFAAHVTLPFLEKIPGLRLTLDASHWCAVAESYLEDQLVPLSSAINRTLHIHARVGYPQGPQVPDPEDPLWRQALETHLGWWKQVIELRRMEGREYFTITPEFGAPPYMLLLPGSHQPITSQWNANVFMMEYLKRNL